MVATDGAQLATPLSALVDADLATSESPSLDAVVKNPPLVRYPGGKNGAGVFHRIINQMPPHEVYIEPFLGSGAILRRKLPAPCGNVGIDVDAGIIAMHDVAGLGCSLVTGDAMGWLRRNHATFDRQTLIYADPPYLGSARAWPARDCYRHEMKDEREHAELLRILTSCPAMVMISGYASPLYDGALAGWRRLDYLAQTRGGPKAEVLWMNYAEPAALHDYRFLGVDFHDRCRIGRKINRWVSRLAAMPVLERAAVLARLRELEPARCGKKKAGGAERWG